MPLPAVFKAHFSEDSARRLRAAQEGNIPCAEPFVKQKSTSTTGNLTFELFHRCRTRSAFSRTMRPRASSEMSTVRLLRSSRRRSRGLLFQLDAKAEAGEPNVISENTVASAVRAHSVHAASPHIRNLVAVIPFDLRINHPWGRRMRSVPCTHRRRS